MSKVFGKLSSFLKDNITKPLIISDKPIQQILGHIMAFVPLILDSLFRNNSVICPHKKTTVYAVLMLLSPFISVTLVALTLATQFFGRKYSKYGIKAIIMKIFPGIISMIFTAGITLGASFLKGDSFACIFLGPPPDPKNFEARSIYKRDFLSLIAKSRIIGWCVIWATLWALFIGLIIRYFVFNSTRIEKLANKINKIRLKETRDIIERKIVDISKADARLNLEKAITDIEVKHVDPASLIKELDLLLETKKNPPKSSEI